MIERGDRQEGLKLPAAQADSHGRHHCPRCQKNMGTLPAGEYTCEAELCGLKFVVKYLELKKDK
jgi:hypothetical protein